MADDTGKHHGDDAEAELGAAVDEAMRAEAKRQFIQRIMDMDRAEGVGRSEHFRNDETYRDYDPDRRDEPTD